MSRILQRIEHEMKQRQRSRAQIITRRVTIGFLLIAIPIISGELFLRLIGYHRPQVDLQAQQHMLEQATQSLNQRFETDSFTYDRHLLWKLSPGGNLAGLNIDDNALLTWSRPPLAPGQADNQIQIVCMGDSVTATTYRTWPQIAEQLASAVRTTQTIHFTNAAVPGYTTRQALRQLPALRSLKPRVVVLCFGWNDHFPALSTPDKELGIANTGSSVMHDLLKDVRLYQLMGAPLDSGILPADAPTDASPTTSSASIARVSLPEFENNLKELIAVVRSWGAIPVIATQPENLKDSSQALLQKNSFLVAGQNARDLHLQYNARVRTIAAETRTALLDIEEEFVRRPRETMLEPDGIHLSGRGHNHVARLVINFLRQENLISDADYETMVRSERHDTTAPDKPRVTWSLSPDHLSTYPGDEFSFSVIPQNSGNTRWLKSHVIERFGTRRNVPYGSGYVYSRWSTVDAPTTGIVSRVPLPQDILPGEATSITMTMKAPQSAGNYELEIGVAAEALGPLSYYGAETTTLTVTTHPRP